MIVELFGPPGAGKTTLACKIATALEIRGVAARTLISARSSELAAVSEIQHSRGRSSSGANASLQAPTSTVLDAVNRELMRQFPPRSLFWRFRLRRYLRQLAASWTRSESDADVVVFDQGYTQALCSLVSLTRSTNLREITSAASLLPQPAVRVCVQVPYPVLLARQQQRIHDMSLLESFLELDPAANLAQAEICSNLRTILDGRTSLRGRVPMLCPDPLDADLEPLLDVLAAATTTQPVTRAARAR